MALKESASQTAGPYVHIGCVPSYAGLDNMYDGQDLGQFMVGNDVKGARIALEGYVYDGAGDLIKDAMLEIWQADHAGLFNSPTEIRGMADSAFTGWGRQPTDGTTGQFRFETIKPGRVPWPDGRLQAPHINLWIVARGINVGLHTRVYFADESAANEEDPLLSQIADQDRVATLIARRDVDFYRFDIRLQGDGETVFLDV